MARILTCGTRDLILDDACVMGVLNVTPDSFSDGGQFLESETAVDHAARLLNDGADCLDVGGESTRPGAASVSEQEELDRVIPVIEAIAARFDTVISVDTSKATVMKQAVAAGAGMINDVRALCGPRAIETAAACGVPVCLMHMQGEPRSMQESPQYAEVVSEVRTFLCDRQAKCIAAGIAPDQIVWDPGFGFGKTLAHNLALLESLEVLSREAVLMVGVSRKRMIGELLGDSHADRTVGSVAVAMLAVQRGAQLVRVHDVAQTVQALTILKGTKSRCGR